MSSPRNLTDGTTGLSDFANEDITVWRERQFFRPSVRVGMSPPSRYVFSEGRTGRRFRGPM